MCHMNARRGGGKNHQLIYIFPLEHKFVVDIGNMGKR